MFRRSQFTFPKGAIFISYADQKLSTLQTIHVFLSEFSQHWLIMKRIPWMVLPSLANQDLKPMLNLPLSFHVGTNDPLITRALSECPMALDQHQRIQQAHLDSKNKKDTMALKSTKNFNIIPTSLPQYKLWIF